MFRCQVDLYMYYKTLIRQHCKKFYQVEVPADVLPMLVWTQIKSNISPESNASIPSHQKDSTISLEVKRALARWHNYELLLAGDEVSYQKFIRVQDEKDKLSFEKFIFLSNIINDMDEHQRKAVYFSCFLRASEEARLRYRAIMKKDEPYDGEQFLTHVFNECPQIYPFWKNLSTEVQAQFPIMFMADTHFRHVLYAEGGREMLATVKQKLKNNEIDSNDLLAFLCRWLVDIAGFRVYEKSLTSFQPETMPIGSIYLTERAACYTLALLDQWRELSRHPDHDAFTNYLNIRAQWLGVESLYLAKLGCQMRLITREEGACLQKWYNSLTIQTRRQYELEVYDLPEPMQETPTYEPAVMAKLQQLGKSLTDAVAIHHQIKESVVADYCAKIVNGEINPRTPLCYSEIAKPENLQPILDYYDQHHALPNFEIDTSENKANVRMAIRPALRLVTGI